MGIRASYFWSFIKETGCSMIRRHPLATRPHDKECLPVSIAVGTVEEDSISASWDFYYRKSQPERAHVRLGTLIRVWRDLEALNLDFAPRQRDLPAKLEGWARSTERIAARQKAEQDQLLGAPSCAQTSIAMILTE